MTKLTKIEQKTYEGKPSGFKVTFDDNRSGNMDEKQSDKGLRDGDNVVVTEIPYTSKAGKTSTLYGVRLLQAGQNTSQQQNIPPSPSPAKTPVSSTALGGAKATATIKAMEFMVDCFIADKITWDQIQAKHKELTGYLNDAIDECNA